MYIIKSLKPKAILVDIDGTIADQTVRNKKCLKKDGTMDWGIYFDKELLLQDKVNLKLKEKILNYYKDKIKVVFLSK